MSFSDRGILRLCAVLGLLAATACGELPRPFKPEVKTNGGNPLLDLSDSPGIVVAPVLEAPGIVAGPLADMLAESLRRENVPATSAGAIFQAYLLEGTVETPPSGAGVGAPLAIVWNLTDAEGRTVDSRRTTHALSAALWQAGDAVALQTVADEAARAVAGAFERPATAAAPPSHLTLGIAGVEGAPGDGNAALATALEAAMRQAALPLVADPASADVLVAGQVAVLPEPAGRDRVAIVWTLIGRDGRTLGDLTQRNTVPHGSLNGAWGGAAYDVAYATIEGMSAILREIGGSGAARPRASAVRHGGQ